MRKWKLTHKFIYEGREVRYGVKGDGPALILVHGTPWSSFNLRHLVYGLSGSFTVYYFDLLGYGQSDKSEADVSLGIQNKLLDALLDYWQLKTPLVVGHDFGGTTVLRNHILNASAYSSSANPQFTIGYRTKRGASCHRRAPGNIGHRN